MEICCICHEEYTNNDTDEWDGCGHVFHTRCIKDCLNRYNTCPECPQSCNETQKNIYFQFGYVTCELKELKNQHEQSLKKTNEIQHLLDKSEQKVLHLQGQIQKKQTILELLQDQNKYLKTQTEEMSKGIAIKTNEIQHLLDKSEQKVLDLQGQIQKNQAILELLQDQNKYLKTQTEEMSKGIAIKTNEIQHLLDKSEQKVLDLQGQIQKNQTILELLQDQNKYLKTQTEEKSKEIAIKTNEIIKLQQISSKELALKNSKLKSLDEQLKNKSVELVKEKTLHVNDKIKMQKLLDSCKSEMIQNRNQHCNSNKKQITCDKINTESQNSHQQLEKTLFVSKTKLNTLNENNFIILNGFVYIEPPLEDVVLHLAKQLEIDCKIKDIENVCFLPEQTLSRNDFKKMSILVNFKTSQLKEEFLATKIKTKLLDAICSLSHSMFTHKNEKMNAKSQYSDQQNNYVILNEFKNMKPPLEDGVLHFAKKMEVDCKIDDIENVCFLPEQTPFPNNSIMGPSLLVKFKTSQIKKQLLSNVELVLYTQKLREEVLKMEMF